jgi:protein-arginine deiminase
LAGCRSEEPLPIVLLGVDASRSGLIDFDDPEDLDHRFEPAPGYGALFLPNLDDSGGLCAGLTADADREVCYDARQERIVNDADLANMARIRTLPLGPDFPEATGRITVDEASSAQIRLHLRTGAGEVAGAFEPYTPGDAIPAEALAGGVELAIEGLSWVVDPDVWSGRIELTFSVSLPNVDEPLEDRVHMDVAPLLFPNHMSPATEFFVSNLGAANAAFRGDLRDAVTQAGVPSGLTEITERDPWFQDFMHTGYMAIPGPDGPRVIHVFFRSANLSYPESLEPVFERIYELEREPMPTLLREAGSVVYTQFHGPGRAGRAEYHPEKGFEPIDLEGVDVEDVVRYLYGSGSTQTYPHILQHIERVWGADTLDSFGNTETTPPYVSPDGRFYPFGRVYRGRGGPALPDYRPDPTLSAIIEAQGMQPIFWLDTSWLAVGHVDETVSFVPTETERGWSLLHAAPLEAVELLEHARDDLGAGEAILFEDRTYPSGGWYPLPAARTVEEVLDDTDVMAATARAAVELQAQLDAYMQEMGLDEADLVPVPFLYEDTSWGLGAYQPGMVNGISLNAGAFAMPKPLGPVVGGVDLFEAHVEGVLAPLGVEVNWIEAWDVYHVGGGHVHCGTNAQRDLPASAWWTEEIGR